MKTLLKTISLAIVFVMVLSFGAFADSPTITLDTPTVDKEAKTATISGTVANPATDTQVTILVVDSSVTSLSNLTDSDIAYVDQVAAENDGTFEFSLAINQDNFSGNTFKAYVGGTGITSVQSAPINFSNMPGDVTGDGHVTLADYQKVVANFGKRTSEGDATGEGEVTLADYQRVVANFGN